jgi:uncharacterized protein (TIGR02594 family)
MPDATPPWLTAMRDVAGVHWAPGDGANLTIANWLQFISAQHPEMTSYCNSVLHEEYFSWCGLTVGYCMAKAGITPVFGSVDTSRFLWAMAWTKWGSHVAAPQPGDVVVFNLGAGDQHVTMFEKDNGNGFWSCLGGNQSHQVKLSNFAKSAVVDIRRPVAVGAVAPVDADPLANAAANATASQRFSACVALVLHSEGGNVDDPQDPGGRTSRGITQRVWDAWRKAHAGLPADVWQAPQEQVVAIYHQNYWEQLGGDGLPAGVDYCVFDDGVLSGTDHSAKALQRCVGVDPDGDVGPKTIAAAEGVDAEGLVGRLCDARLAYLRTLGGWNRFGAGWTNRVQAVRVAARAMASAAKAAPAQPLQPVQPQQPVAPAQPPQPIQPPPPAQPMQPVQPVQPPPAAAASDALLDQFKQLVARLEMAMSNGTTISAPAVSAPSQADLSGLIQQAMTLVQAVNPTPQPAAAAPAQAQNQARQAIALLTALLNAKGGPIGAVAPLALGPVNGALGQTIGNLLNGSKSAIGIGGALATSVLQQVGPSVSMSSVLPFLASSAGLGSVAMPIFLALTAWGVLGKLEKWAQASPPPTP